MGMRCRAGIACHEGTPTDRCHVPYIKSLEDLPKIMQLGGKPSTYPALVILSQKAGVNAVAAEAGVLQGPSCKPHLMLLAKPARQLWHFQ